MGPQRKILYSITIALVIFFISMATTIVPCQSSPNVPNPSYTWKLCTLNPDVHAESGKMNLYFGYTNSLTEAYIITLVLPFAIVFIIFHFTSRSRRNYN